MAELKPICLQCPRPAHGKDGLCLTCRICMLAARFKKYHWTPEMDEQLKRIYRSSRTKTDLSRNLAEFVKRHGFPRHIVSNRAVTLDLRMWRVRLWTEEELDYLRGMAGDVSLTKMAKFLGRSESSLKCKMSELQITAERCDGFSIKQLCELMGTRHDKVSKWIGRGWLVMDDHLVTEASVRRFLWDHMDAYRFASCEEWWLKLMLNPDLGRKASDRRRASPVDRMAA